MNYTPDHITRVLYEELMLCEAIKDSPGPRPWERYTIRDLHVAAINELWDLAHLLGVSKRLHKMVDRHPPDKESDIKAIRGATGETLR